ncbi:hypothetical protein [Agromyces sp. NPDC058104]|uniref:hypothetical protein n=1 Tax=Agromyces sp. NPDC058104 TaxID=3346342 RepID=UPI0036DDC9DA
MNKSIISRGAGIAGLVLALALGNFAAPAYAADAEPDWTYLTEFNEQYGVSAEDQANLLEKARAGELPDSMTGASPVSVEASADGLTKIERFEDGSVLVSEIEEPAVVAPGQIQPRGIAGCTQTSGSGWVQYTGCTVSTASSYATLSFKASYIRASNGTGQITRADTPSAQTYYGSCDASPTINVVRAVSQGASLPAVATEHCHYVSYNGATSEDLYQSLRVTGAEAWITMY